MLKSLGEREDGRASLLGGAGFSHRPARFAAAALGDAGLARRLGQTAALAGHSGAVNALAWTEAGELLASGGEDCRLRLWRGAGGPPDLLHSLDTVRLLLLLHAAACIATASHGAEAGRDPPVPVTTTAARHPATLHPPPVQGHTSNILGAAFLPGCPAGDQLLTCSADRQIRHLNVTKGAVRPYLVHAGAVRAVVPLDPRALCLCR